MSLIDDLLLLSPQGLWFLAALAIPILIHLFSRSKGKRVLIGNIELIRQARKERVREIRLSQWLLLLLRLLIVAVAVLLMADLARQGLEDRNEDSAYVTPQWLSASNDQDRAALFTSHRQHVYLLSEGLPEINSATLEPILSQAKQARSVSAWALLSESLATINHQGAVTVYATTRVSDWPTRILSLPREVNWSLIEGHSEIVREPVEVMIVFDPDRARDATRMEQALEVLRQHRTPNLTWSRLSTAEDGDTVSRPDWLIWLSDQTIASDLSDPSGSPLTILTDQSLTPGQALENHGHTSLFSGTKITVHQVHSDLETPDAAVIWGIDDGGALLTQVQTGAVRTLNFASRFNTDWSDLQLQADFPELLLRVMQGQGEQFTAYPATIEQSQVVEDGSGAEHSYSPSRSLQLWLAMLLTLLWMAERWLSERQRHV